MFEFGVTVVFSLRNGDGGRADVSMSVLMVLVCGVVLIEKEFCVHGVGLLEHVVVVSVWGDL